MVDPKSDFTYKCFMENHSVCSGTIIELRSTEERVDGEVVSIAIDKDPTVPARPCKCSCHIEVRETF